jgi:hypothetical protein
MVGAGVWLGSTVSDARDLVKIRNSLLLEVGPADTFDWSPQSTPADFHSEHLRAPQPIQDAVDRLLDPATRTSDFDVVLAIARNLVAQHKKPGIPIQKSTVAAYRAIVGSGAGYCADYTQVMNGLAQAAGIPIREWGMSFDGYSGNGHAFSEIFDRQRQHWIFVDSFYSFYVTDEHGAPLSVADFRRRLLTPAAPLQVVPIRPQKFAFKTAQAALDYYRRGADTLYLWWGNDVFSYDAHPLVSRLDGMPNAVQQLAAVALGVQPKLVVAAGQAQAEGLDELRLLRRLVVTIMVAGSAFAVLSVVLAVRWFRLRRGPRRS